MRDKVTLNNPIQLSMNKLQNVTEQILLYRKYLSDIDFMFNEIAELHHWNYSYPWISEWFAMCWENLVGRHLTLTIKRNTK